MIACSPPFRYAPPPLSGPDEHGRRGATCGSRDRERLAQARVWRDACARLAHCSRQCRDLCDDRDRLHHAWPAVAARARGRRARLQSLPARDGARHRHRRGAGADRCCEALARARAARRSGARRISRCCRPSRSLSSPGSTLRRRSGFCLPSANRPISRATQGPTCAAISGASCRTFCSSPPAASSPRLSGRARP